MNGVLKFSSLFLGIAIGAGIFSFVILNESKKLENKYEVRINDQIIIADMVKSEKDRERGLSGRDSLGVNEGMLFNFSQNEQVVFWMKGMKFPIDIVWIKDGVVLGYIERVDPQVGVSEEKLEKYISPEPVNQVLELSAGRAKQMHLFVGARVNAKPIIH